MKTNLKINHDYLTLKVTYDVGKAINMTINRNGCKVTGHVDTPPAAFNGVFKQLARLESKSPFANFQELMEAMQAKADAAIDLNSFVVALEGIPSKN